MGNDNTNIRANPESVVPSEPVEKKEEVKQAEPVEKKEEVVTVPVSVLENLMKEVKELNRKVNSTVDRNRLERFNQENKKSVLPICKISYFKCSDGKDRLVLGWTNMSRNKAEYMNGRENVDQKVILLLRDEESTDGIMNLEVDYVASFQNRYKEDVEIISKKEMSDGRVILEVEKKDGERLEMDSRFVN